jgi:SAM-dependent methyltransferase
VNYELIGGEMTDWSDREPVGGPLLTHLISRLEPLGRRVLVAGPHAPALIDALAAYAEVTCLVRAQRDAAALGDRRGVTVRCGSLAKLTDSDHYDVIVALDGVERLCSVEGPQYDWTESVQALRRALRPGGALLLSVENELGVHRLVDRTTVTFAHTEDAWLPLGEFGSKPGSPERLESRLAAEGLTVGWLGTAWPSPSAPAFAATPAMLRYGPAGALGAAASAAMAAAYAGTPVLSDPRRLAAAAIRGGLGAEFAPAWLVVASRGSAPTVELPQVLIGDRADPALPAGQLLEELLIGACLRHDLPAIRRLLTGWAAGQPTATFDNLLVDGDTYAILDSDRAGEEPAAVLARFAQTLLAGGYAQPWPAAADVPSLTTILSAAAGLGTGTLPPAATMPPVPDSLREHEEQVRRLEEQLADAAVRIAYAENELIKRDTELRRARLQIDTFSGHVGYRLTRLSARAARTAVRAVRRSPLFKD